MGMQRMSSRAASIVGATLWLLLKRGQMNILDEHS
jgi:hypothetical protein